jgi:hypothetical protein
MEVTQLSIPKKKAYKLWKEYRDVIKQGNSEPYLKEMKVLYNTLKSGRKVIDIYEAFKKVGVNTKGEPRLAIAPADFRVVRFTKASNGSGSFHKDSWNYSTSKFNYIHLPDGTFPEWKKEEGSDWNIENKDISTKVPTIPAKYFPKGKLSNYWILWEAEDWKDVTKDPMLLRRITRNLFVVLAVWNLTPLERALIRGR